MSFCVNESVFFHDHEKIQFAHKFRRNKSFDKHYSKTHFKTQNCRYFKKIKKIKKFVTENIKNVQKRTTKRCQCGQKRC